MPTYPQRPTTEVHNRMKRLNPVPSDLDIAQAAELKPIVDIAASLGLGVDDLEAFGKYKAKVHLDVIERHADLTAAQDELLDARGQDSHPPRQALPSRGIDCRG